MRKSLVTWLMMGIALAAFCGGCGGGADTITRAHLAGDVTLNGEPVAQGTIQFIPLPGVEGAPVKVLIKEGKYNSSQDTVDDRGIPIGKNRVEILAYQATGKQVKNMMGEMEDEVLQLIPDKYNTRSELELEIQAGNHEHNFELTR